MTGRLAVIGLGCMRLSTAPDRDDGRGVAVIHAALDAGATLLDTADAYCFDDRDAGHNERLVARALAAWPGDRSRITVATKGGIRRPKSAWVNDGPHDAGPPSCWCRKPIPGSVIDFAIRRGVSLEQSIVIGSSAADRTMADRIGASAVEIPVLGRPS